MSAAMTTQKQKHWQSILDLVNTDEEKGLTRTEAFILKVKALEVVYNPQDWNAYDVETCRIIVRQIDGVK